MRLSAATKALFDDGAVGHRVLQDLSLPADLFPVVDSWNQFPSLSPERQNLLRTSGFGAPIAAPKTPITDCSMPIKKKIFHSLNAGAVRYSPNHRLSTNEDIYASQQRASFGCSIILVRVPLDENGFSAPFFVIAGPMATAANGEFLDTRNTLALSADVDLPPIHGDVIIPDILAATTVSLLPNAREWVDSITGDTAVEQLRQQGNCLTVFDYGKLHNTVMTLDVTGQATALFAKDAVLQSWDLWAPAIIDQGPITMDEDIMKRWCDTSSVPPDPRTSYDWQPSDTHLSEC
jgi:hypothetical protein